MTLAASTAAWVLHVPAAASSGPAVSMAARTGPWPAIALGALVRATAALFGTALLFRSAPALLWGFNIAGGLFLIRVALQMWRHAVKPLDTGSADTPPRSPASTLRPGLVTQLSNPKPAVFFGAVFVGIVPPGTTLPGIALLLCAIFLNAIARTILVARAFSFDGPRRTCKRLQSTIDRSFGSLPAVPGLKVALQ